MAHYNFSDVGPVLFGAWYKQPSDGAVASIHACSEEWQRLSVNFVATILVGDLNVHHTRWLRHSNGVSVEGSVLLRFCSENALKQHVKSPTREGYLLDLVISDITPSRAVVQPRIFDHNMVLAGFNIGVPETLSVRRVVYDYSKASWGELQSELENMDWSPMDVLYVDTAEQFFAQSVS